MGVEGIVFPMLHGAAGGRSRLLHPLAEPAGQRCCGSGDSQGRACLSSGAQEGGREGLLAVPLQAHQCYGGPQADTGRS